MEYHVYHPCATLAKYIKCYWTLDATDKAAIRDKQRIFPDGCIELIFQYGDLFEEHKEDGAHLQPRSFIHGQLQQYIDITPPANAGTLGVRFHPGGLQPFLHFHSADLTQQSVCIGDIWQHEGKALSDMVLHAKNNLQRIALVEQFFMTKLRKGTNELKTITHCVQTIISSKGNISIQQLCKNEHISRRQLERQFEAHVGLSPKLLSRITRFQYALQLLDRHSEVSLTSLAYESGFYDQPHFIRDFKTFTGMSPGQYYKDKPELASLFVADQ